jgi:ADP-ribose pyrophosphatase YjhB (NUDIX family)
MTNLSGLTKDSYCSYCGQAFAVGHAWPRQCPHCAQISYRNPLPVAVLLLPIDDGLLFVRRNIDPQRGKLALPGGFIEVGESWQSAAARELFEEAGLTIDAAQIKCFDVHSAPDGTVLIFGLGPVLTSAALPAFQPTAEATDCLVLRAPEPLAFSLHTQVVNDYFTRKSPIPKLD